MTDDPEQPSLVGPPAAAAATTDQPSMVGMPDLTPEEKERLHNELLQKKELGFYTNAELLAGIVGNAGDPERQDPVRNKMGVWLKPGDFDYETARAEAEQKRQHAAMGMVENVLAAAFIADPMMQTTQFNEESLKSAQDDKKEKTVKDKKDDYQEVVQDIQKMAVVNEGGVDPHFNANERALQKIRAGASTVELQNVRGQLAAVNQVAYAGVENINYEKMNEIHSNPPTSGEGVMNALASANEKKRLRNEQFAQEMLRRKEKGQT